MTRGHSLRVAAWGWERRGRLDPSARRAEAPGRDACEQRIGQLVADERESGLEERDGPRAAAARLRPLVQRGEDPECGPDAVRLPPTALSQHPMRGRNGRERVCHPDLGRGRVEDERVLLV